jgi:4-diphosphocytidyl-2-C-methyl-D-erythritol kinase
MADATPFTLITRAPAKVNWTLEVLGRRPDGYHEIVSLLSTISLCDRLTLTPAPVWSVEVVAPEPLRSELLSGDNLVERALAALRAAAGPDLPAARLTLEKRIPTAAGLGGGSSDAAATLRLVVAHWRRVAGPTVAAALGRRLHAIAAGLGTDVPFFLRGGTQLARGRGELLTALPVEPRRPLVLLVPPFVLPRKTARLYALLTPRQYTDGARTARLAEALAAGDEAALCREAGNAFDAVAEQAFPNLGRYRARLEEVCGGPAHLSGAGPALFACVPDAATARTAAERLRRMGLAAWAVSTLGHARAARVVVRRAAMCT